MNTDAKVAVILPTYNRADRICASIESVLAQSYQNFVLLIIDDASSDDTSAVVSRYRDGRIRYYRSDRNQGAAAARNLGLSYVPGDVSYIAFEDSDDIWRQRKLEKQVFAMQSSPSAGICYHKISYALDSVRRYILPDEQIPLEKKSGDIYSQLLYENMIDCPAMLIRKDIIEKVGGFDTSFPALEDYDLALRICRETEAVFLNEILLDSAISDGGISSNSGSYLIASCKLVGKYKKDYLATGNFDRRIQKILSDATQVGMQELIIKLLETVLRVSHEIS